MYQLKIPGRYHFSPGLQLVASADTPQGIRAALEQHSREGGSLSFLNLAGLDLREARFADNTNFEDTNFSGARLDGMHARGGVFARCDLSRVIMTGADIRSACFIAAIADGLVADNVKAKKASFSGAKIRGAVFNGADLRSTDFSHADIGGQGATFKDAELLLAQMGRLALLQEGAEALAEAKTPLDVVQQYAFVRNITPEILEKYPSIAKELEDAQ